MNLTISLPIKSQTCSIILRSVDWVGHWMVDMSWEWSDCQHRGSQWLHTPPPPPPFPNIYWPCVDIRVYVSHRLFSILTPFRHNMQGRTLIHQRKVSRSSCLVLFIICNKRIFVSRKAPPHTAWVSRYFLQNQDVEVMDWPSKSQCMDLWDQMTVHICDMDNPSITAPQLPLAMQQAWVALVAVRLRTLVQSMMGTVCAGHTHYQPNLDDAIDPFYRLTNFEKFSMSILFAMAIIFWYMRQLHPPDNSAHCLHLPGNYSHPHPQS